MKIEIFGLDPSKSKKLKRVIRSFESAEGLKKDLNVIFVDGNYIHELNKRFLKRDFVTDVLSFDLDDIAEIYILRDVAVSFEKAWETVLHGLLHLKGYDHETEVERTKMEEKAKKLLHLR